MPTGHRLPQGLAMRHSPTCTPSGHAFSIELHREPHAAGFLRDCCYVCPAARSLALPRNIRRSDLKSGKIVGLIMYASRRASCRFVSALRLLFVWTALGGGAAHGDPLAKPKTRDARQHLERGNKLYTLRDFDKAIEEYRAGLLVEDAPVFQYNLAQAYRLSGNYQQALWFYERFEKRAHPTGELKQAIF